jgi:hypothetical protein
MKRVARIALAVFLGVGGALFALTVSHKLARAHHELDCAPRTAIGEVAWFVMGLQLEHCRPVHDAVPTVFD